MDSDRFVLYVLLPASDEGIHSIGAGATDEGLNAACKVMVTE